MKKKTFLLLLATALFSCHSSRISKQDLSFLYRESGSQMDVRFLVYNFRADSTRIYFRLNTDDFLYQKDIDGLFKTNVILTFYILENYESSLAHDTLQTIVTDEGENEQHKVIIQFADFKKPLFEKYLVLAVVKDLNRHTKNDFYFNVNNSSRQSTINFLVTDLSGIPMFTNYLKPEQKFKIQTADSSNMKLYIRFFNADFPLALPPHKVEDPMKFSYRSDKTVLFDLSKGDEFMLREKGIYHFQPDSTIRQGLTLFRFEDDFPEVTESSQLIAPLRYMTTKKEYDYILHSADQKKAIDDFWIDLARSKARGKELIRTYYSRVVHANSFFSSYLEGWKSDRGLIYIIFGPPDVVFRSDEYEDWNYSVTVDHDAINFTFEKINNPFTENDYYLKRSLKYEPIWYYKVEQWRQGVRYEE